jgi:hypothetical protein
LATKRSATSVVAALVSLASIAVTRPSFADGGNPAFGLPNVSESAPAVPGLPGQSSAAIYYHSSVDAHVNNDPILGGVIDRGVVDEFLGPTYRLETQVPASVGLLRLAGYFEGIIGATLTGSLGQTISGSRSISSVA